MNFIRRVLSYLRMDMDWRRWSANILMIAFIVLPTIGAFMIYSPAGWVAAGLLSGIVGYILGAE